MSTSPQPSATPVAPAPLSTEPLSTKTPLPATPSELDLGPLANSFILHFGQMGGCWGINRTVGQIYALLYISARPLHADEISSALKVSRSNVSMGLKELGSWGLIGLHHFAGDRRDYFNTPEDIWAIFRKLATERKKREIDPTLSMLRDALMQTPVSQSEIHAQSRMRAMHDFLDQISGWFDQVHDMEPAALMRLMNMGVKIKTIMQSTGLMNKPQTVAPASHSILDQIDWDALAREVASDPVEPQTPPAASSPPEKTPPTS